MSVVSPRLVVLALTAALLLAGCGHEGDGRHVTRDPDAPAQYVALGDSYTSAPGVPHITDPRCYRSTRNYPSLVADELDLTLTDVSCGGAATTAFIEEQQTPNGTVPPQFEALTDQTELVTVGIGGNDYGLFGELLAACLGLEGDGSPCRDRMNEGGSDKVLDTIDVIQGRLVDALEGVKKRAPNAEVVLVGYPQLAPERVRCEALPLSPGDYGYFHEVFVALGAATEQAAEDADVRYADVLTASEGHDICAGEDAWINGNSEDPARPASPMHPFAEEQEAVADLVVAAVDE